MQKEYFKNSNEWEDWLEKHFDKEQELWLVYFKKHTNVKGISYEESVNSALCWGWIDGLVKKLDEDRYARKFTPRKENSVWSESNKKRVELLIAEKKMKPAGMQKVEAAKQNGNWDKVISPPVIDLSIPAELKQALVKNKQATEFFENLSNSHKKEYLGWIKTAKRSETRERRINETIRMLNKGKKLGPK